MGLKETHKTEVNFTNFRSWDRPCVRIPFAHPEKIIARSLTFKHHLVEVFFRGALLKAPRERPQEHRHLLPLYHATVGLKAPNDEGIVPEQRHSFS